MPTIAITLNLSCCRCKSKIQKILWSLQERCGFVFEKVVFEKDKVMVTGPFDAVDLCCKLRCKAGCFAGNIDIVPPPPPPPTTATTPTTPPATTPPPKPKPVPCEKPIPIPIPYPYPYPCPYPCSYPYPQPCPSSCSTPPPPPRSCSPPPPPPPCPPPRSCIPPPPPPPCPPPRSCSPPPPPVCGGRCPTWTPCHCRGYQREFFCEDPDGTCAVM